MRVVCVSYFYDREITCPETLLDRYGTLTGWAEGLLAAGADVTVTQRFARDTEVERKGILYRFIHDPAARFGHVLDKAPRVNAAVASLRPDIVHAHSIHFARQAAHLKSSLPKTPILLQDHAGFPPKHPVNRWTLGLAMRAIDAVSFTVPEQVTPWQDAGIIGKRKPLIELPEGSSPFRLRAMADARHETHLSGEPQCLWVGRLNRNKDPLTVLAGFAKALSRLPNAQLAMVYDEEDLLPDVKRWLAANPGSANHIDLLGKRPHSAMEALYNSSHFFLLGSDYDGGSGYSALEALSCGVTPLITDIPSFRAVTQNGCYGGLWNVGDPDALAELLVAWHAQWNPVWRERVRDYFDAVLGFPAIGRQAMTAYSRILGRTQA